MITTRHFLLAALFTLATASVLSARTWKEAGSDRTFDGDFVKIDGESVVIRRGDGSIISVPLAKFSDEDQAFAKEQAAAAPAPLATTTTTTGTTGSDIVTLSRVHLCCEGCEKGVSEALAGIEGLEIAVSRTNRTVTLSGKNLDKGLEALASSGYYGDSDNSDFEIGGTASEGKKSSVDVEGVHLCCNSCVRAVEKAMEDVEGFESQDASKNAATFTVKGSGISPASVLAALRKQGLSGTVK